MYATNHVLVPKYPSVAMTSNVQTINGATLTVSTSASNANSNTQAFYLFNESYSNVSLLWTSSNGTYNAGAYVGNNSFNGVSGEWVRMSMKHRKVCESFHNLSKEGHI